MFKSIVKDVFKVKEDDIIKFDDLDKLQYGNWCELSQVIDEAKGIKVMKIPTTLPHQIVCAVRIPEGASYTYTSASKERITPIYGRLQINNSQVIEEKSTQTIQRFTKNKIIGLENSLVLIEITK